MIILCDVDNVLADDSWRVGFVRHEHPDPIQCFHAYHVASALDSVANLHLVRVPGARVVLLTAMPEEYEPYRREWLTKARVPYEFILYRPRGNFDSAVEVKRAMVRLLRVQYQMDFAEVVAAYDDRRDVVEMFCEEGLPGKRVFIVDYSAEPKA